MGIGGIRHGISDEDFIEALEQSEGVVTQAAKLLRVTPPTIYNIINENPHLEKALKDVRFRYQQKMLDRSEHVLQHLVHQEQDMGLAYKSAVYTLNNLGRPRGYSHPEVAAMTEQKCLADAMIECSSRADSTTDGDTVYIEITDDV